MYVCVCNAIREDMVESLVEEGYSFAEIRDLTGCSGTCGSCLEFAETHVETLRARLSARRASHGVLPVLSPA